MDSSKCNFSRTRSKLQPCLDHNPDFAYNTESLLSMLVRIFNDGLFKKYCIRISMLDNQLKPI